MPPHISPNDPLLAARICLPETPRVAVAVLRPAAASDDSLCAAHDLLEHARRQVLARSPSPVLFDNIFPTVRCGADPALYLFLLASQESSSAALHRLSDLQLEHLDQTTQHVLSIEDLASSEHAQTHAHFLEAVRSFILSDLTEAPIDSPGYASPKRLGDGFILERRVASSDWASGWDQSANTRPIVHFRLQAQISFTHNVPSHFIVHAIPVPTPFSPLPSSANPGLPIILMPYGTPAYFLSDYSGPSHSLIKQFRDSLKGLGAGAWEGPSPSTRPLDSDRTSFIVGWIRVENRQGEDKGTLFVWPSRLCLSYSDTFTHRQPLAYIPEMPAPLQASPQLPAQEGVSPVEAADDSCFQDAAEPLQYEPLRPPPHSDPLRAFQSFTVSKSKDIRSLANEVGGYVDAVVRERERERERLKKERELAGVNTSPRMSRNVAQPASTSRAQPQPPSTPQLPHPTTNRHPSVPHIQHAEAFYPSPPQSGQTPHAPPPDNTSPEMEVVSLPPTSAGPTYHPPAEEAAPPPPPDGAELSRDNSFDSLFGDNGPSAWGQTSNENSYMDMGMGMNFSMNGNMEMNMNMDMDMDFDMEMPASRTASANPFGTTNHNGALTFEDAFTDDDFSFFDQPSKSNPPPPIVSPANAIPPKTIPQAPVMAMDIDISRPFHLPSHHRQPSLDQTPGASGPGPPLSAGLGAAPWTPATQDGATPGGPRLDSVPPALDLTPFTPGGVSPDLHQYRTSPETPTVQLIFDHGHGTQSVSKPGSPTTQRASHSSILFDPIPFSTSHKNSDEKYSHGKFAFLPSPSPEPGYDPGPTPPRPPWRTRYNSLTDPRIGVYKQLVCVKQKASAASSPPKPYPHESDWMDISANAYQTPPNDNAMDVSSDSDSDEEDGLSITSDPSNTSPLQSRPCTPPPAYLPPGPSLLHLRFAHAPLLPLSTPLRSPGAVPLHQHSGPLSATGHGSMPFASVPTPVSPAAALGAASERSKTLESMAHAIAVEFVENTLWAEVWRVNNQRCRADEGARRATVWPDDLKAAAEVLKRINGTKEDGKGQEEALCKIESLFALDPSTKLVPYEPPSVSVGKGDAILQLLPSALRFWQKLGLGPKGGQKDVEVYAFYEDADDQKRPIVDAWLTAASNAYKTKHMGQFIRGFTNPANDALLPIRFDASFRQTFNLFIANIIKAGPPIAIILFVPVTSMTFTSPSLRSVISGIQKRLKDFDGRQITFHFVPDAYLIDLDHSPRGYRILDELCMVIYNRIQVEVERNLSRRIPPPRRFANCTRFQEPTFTLARPLNSKVALVRSAHTSLDVMDRFTFLHVGYGISPCKKWVFACCVDQRGEEYDLGLWLLSPPEPGDGEVESTEIGDGERDNACEKFAVDKVWSLVVEVARRADVEWRVVVSKRGLMSSTEIEAWTEVYAKDAMARPKSSTPLHLILASADHKSPFTFVPDPSSTLSTSSAPANISPPRVPGKGTVTTAKVVPQFSDASATYYAIFPTSKLSISIPLKLDMYSASLVPEPALTHSTSPNHRQDRIPLSDYLDIPMTTASSPNPLTAANSPGVTVSSKQDDPTSLPPPIPFIPLSSSTLVRVSPQAPISMLHIYIVKVLHPADYLVPHSTSLPTPAPPPSNQDELTRELTRNFYELSVLSSARFHLDRCEAVGVDPVLPLHLSAVEAMMFSIDCEWDEESYHCEGSSE